MDTDDEQDECDDNECEQTEAERSEALRHQNIIEYVDNHYMVPSMTCYGKWYDTNGNSSLNTESTSRVFLSAHIRAAMTFFEPNADFKTIQASVMEDGGFPSEYLSKIEEEFWEPGSPLMQMETVILAPFVPPKKPEPNVYVPKREREPWQDEEERLENS